MAGLFSFLTPRHRPGLLWLETEHTVQLARVPTLEERPLILERFAEVPRADDAAISGWLADAFPERRGGYLPAYVAFHPAARALFRENLQPKRLEEPGYVAGLVAAHTRQPDVTDWHIAALNPAEGEPIAIGSGARVALVFGLPVPAAREMQQRLRRFGVLPRRLELGTLVLLGALSRYLREQSYPHAVAVCEVGIGQTRLYVIGRDGVHTPAALPHGLLSMEESAMKELGVADAATALAQLSQPTDELRAHGRRLVRMLSRHLKPAIDSFEMQTGQPIGGLYAAHLPSRLGWLEETLAQAVDVQFIVPDVTTWMASIDVNAGSDVPRQAFPIVSLLAPLAAPAIHGAKS